MSETLVFEFYWNNGRININGFELRETLTFDEFMQLKTKLLEPFLDDIYRIHEFQASCFLRVSILRRFPHSFEIQGFRPISFVSELPLKAEGQHCLMITIPGSVEEALQLKEDDQIIWSEYEENRIVLEIRRKQKP
jgi:hypothetical protein